MVLTLSVRINFRRRTSLYCAVPAVQPSVTGIADIWPAATDTKARAFVARPERKHGKTDNQTNKLINLLTSQLYDAREDLIQFTSRHDFCYKFIRLYPLLGYNIKIMSCALMEKLLQFQI